MQRKNKKGAVSSFIKNLFSGNKNEYKGASKDNNEGRVNIELKPTALVLVTYILMLVSKFIDLTLLNRDNEYMSVIILQMMIFLLPGVLWCMLGGEKYKRGLRIVLPKADTLLLIVSATMVMMSGSLLMSMLFGGLESLSNNFSLYDIFISKKDGSFSNSLYLILAYAALPALCEEFVYRGILCYEYERGGVFRAIVFSSVFFALLHFNLSNIFVYLFCGAMLALVLYASRSLWGAVIAHFLYNIFGVFGQPYMATLYRLTKDSRLLVIIVGMLFFLFATLFCKEASRLYKKYLREGKSSAYRRPDSLSVSFMDSVIEHIKDPCAIACVAIYIIAVVISWL